MAKGKWGGKRVAGVSLKNGTGGGGAVGGGSSSAGASGADRPLLSLSADGDDGDDDDFGGDASGDATAGMAMSLTPSSARMLASPHNEDNFGEGRFRGGNGEGAGYRHESRVGSGAWPVSPR